MFSRGSSSMISLLLLVVVSIVAVSVNGSSSSVASKVSLLEKLAGSDSYYGIVKLDGASYDIVTAAPRNYSLHVLMTALSSEHNCLPCQKFHSELQLVASAWKASQPEAGKLYLAVLDYKDGPQVFQRLQINSVPHSYYFAPTEGPLKPKQQQEQPELYDFNRRGLDAESYANFIEGTTGGTKLHIRRPVDYTQYIFGGSILFLLTIIARFAYKYLALVFENKRTWTVISVATIVLFCSGHMWNHIRGPPYAGQKDGKPEIFAPGFSSQYVGETQAVGMLYALIAVTFVALITKPTTLKSDSLQRIVAYIFLGAFVFLYSLLLDIFKIKNGGYPFKMLL